MPTQYTVETQPGPGVAVPDGIDGNARACTT